MTLRWVGGKTLHAAHYLPNYPIREMRPLAEMKDAWSSEEGDLIFMPNHRAGEKGVEGGSENKEGAAMQQRRP